jgi:protein-disulfide isomerase
MKTTSPKNLILPIATRDHLKGSLRAPIQLIEYGDYQCPYCGEAYRAVKNLLRELGPELGFTFRNFPLTSHHAFAQHAAEAAEAAAGQGAFWPMYSTLFENQHALQDDDLFQYARTLGLDADRLLRELRSGVYRARVEEDLSLGQQHGVEGTPTFFVNGTLYDGQLSAASLRDFI